MEVPFNSHVSWHLWWGQIFAQRNKQMEPGGHARTGRFLFLFARSYTKSYIVLYPNVHVIYLGCSLIYSILRLIFHFFDKSWFLIAFSQALECWRTRFATSSQEGTWLEHARVCAEIGLQCMRSNPLERPTTQDIIAGIDNLEHIYGSIETGVLATEVSLFIHGIQNTRSNMQG